ncbi:hypothetical protein KAH55_08990, partial [bacterium]|nr:hypothetical protein [bacterium]
AAVNLMVAAGLVSFATSLKLPLSTTFVTFMVAMATSLADKSWGRDSAVYRVNGVLTVIAGWFFTAFMAFTASFLFSTLIYHFELPAIIVLVILAVFFFYRSNHVHQRREEKLEKGGLKHQQELADLGHTKQIVKEVVQMLEQVQVGVHKSVSGVCAGERKKLKSAWKLACEVKEDSCILSNDMFNYMKMADEFDSEAGPAFSRTISAIEVISANFISFTLALFEHIENNHQSPEDEDAAELKAAEKIFSEFICKLNDYLENNLEPNYHEIQENAINFHDQIKKFQRNQIKRVKKQKAGTRRSLLFVTTVSRLDRMAQQVAVLGETFTVMKHVVISGK